MKPATISRRSACRGHADCADCDRTWATSYATEHELVTTLFDLGRQVTGVLDLEELLKQIPRLIGA